MATGREAHGEQRGPDGTRRSGDTFSQRSGLQRPCATVPICLGFRDRFVACLLSSRVALPGHTAARAPRRALCGRGHRHGSAPHRPASGGLGSCFRS